jgi:hypothetical protein
MGMAVRQAEAGTPSLRQRHGCPLAMEARLASVRSPSHQAAQSLKHARSRQRRLSSALTGWLRHAEVRLAP